MSTYFTIYTKLRNAPKDAAALELMYLCTTPARELKSQMGFEYDKYTTIENVAFLEKIRDYYKEKYDRLVELKKRMQELAKRYNDMAAKAENVEVLNALLEKANDEEDELNEVEEEMNSAYTRYCRVELICDMYNDNHNAYEFYYYYG